MRAILTIILIYTSFFTQAQDFVWAKGIDGSGWPSVSSLAVDNLSNIYITGNFHGSVDFNPGFGDSTITSNGQSDAYVLKLDEDGEFIWVRTLRLSDSQYAGMDSEVITIDAENNIYYGGWFIGRFYFDSGLGVDSLLSDNSVAQITGSHDGFIHKLNANGDHEWITSIGGGGHDWLYGLSTDLDGNVYSTGYFQNTVDFDPSLDTAHLTSEGLSSAYINKLNADGEFIWAKSFAAGVDALSTGRSIKVAESGSISVLGDFVDTVDFDPGAGVLNLIGPGTIANGDNISFVASLNANGDLNWVKDFDQFLFYEGTFVTIDGLGNTICTGYFEESIDLDPGSGVVNMTSNGGKDVFILKLDPSGEFIWSKSIGGSLFDEPTSIAVDHDDAIYISGNFRETVDFDPGLSVNELTSTNLESSDAFVLKLNSNGDFVWARSVGGNNSITRAVAIDADIFGNVFTAGSFSDTVDFNPGPGTDYLFPTPDPYWEAYVQKLNQNVTSIDDKLVTSPTIYPNPNSGICHINTTGSATVFDSMGRKVLFTTEKTAPIKVDMTSLNSGMYIIQVINDMGVISERVVKQ
jgi:hypothetical protein